MTCGAADPHFLDKLPQFLLAVVYANESGVQLRLPQQDGRLHGLCSVGRFSQHLQCASACALALL